jgi:hypothetical protein
MKTYRYRLDYYGEGSQYLTRAQSLEWVGRYWHKPADVLAEAEANAEPTGDATLRGTFSSLLIQKEAQ